MLRILVITSVIWVRSVIHGVCVCVCVSVGVLDTGCYIASQAMGICQSVSQPASQFLWSLFMVNHQYYQ